MSFFLSFIFRFSYLWKAGWKGVWLARENGSIWLYNYAEYWRWEATRLCLHFTLRHGLQCFSPHSAVMHDDKNHLHFYTCFTVQYEQIVIKLSLPSHVQLPVHSEIRAAGGYSSLYGCRGELWVSGGYAMTLIRPLWEHVQCLKWKRKKKKHFSDMVIGIG